MSFYDIQGNYFKEDIKEGLMHCDEECRERRRRAREEREQRQSRFLGRNNEGFIQTNVNVEKQNRRRFWFF